MRREVCEVSRGSQLLTTWRESQQTPGGKPMTRGGAAKHLQVDRPTYTKWETGCNYPSLFYAYMLQDRCGVPINAWREPPAQTREAA